MARDIRPQRWPDPARATAIAYCGDTPKLTKRTDSATVVAPKPRGRHRGVPTIPLVATAKCPIGTTVQLGGFAVDDEVPNLAVGFFPSAMKATSARKWRVKGIAVIEGLVLTAVAGCADLPAPDPVKKTEPGAGGGSLTSANAKCPKGDAVVMGGFKQTPHHSMGGGPKIRALKRSGSRKWKATWEFGDPGSLTAIAYCA